jgi:hypothetical protein
MKFRRISHSLMGIAASLLIAATVWAQTTNVNGIVQRVDVPGRTIYLTDGRAVVLQSNARLTVAGREVALVDIQPGWSLMTTATPAMATTPPAGSNTLIIVQPPAPPASVAVSPLPAPAPQPPQPPQPIDATGVVAQVDPRNGTVTLADGRVLRVTSRTTLWQPVTVNSVVPGTAVYVRNAEPVAFQPGTHLRAVPSGLTYWMGTVRSVDPSRSRVELTDGTVVRLKPDARARFHGQALSIVDLRPGDEIVIGTPRPAPVIVAPSGAAVGSALPRQAFEEWTLVDAETLHVVQRVQVR